MDMKKNKKGAIMDELSGIAIGVAGLAITLVVVFVMLAQAKSNSTVAADANATAALTKTTTAVAIIPDWLPIIIIAFIGVIILGVVYMFSNKKQ